MHYRRRSRYINNADTIRNDATPTPFFFDNVYDGIDRRVLVFLHVLPGVGIKGVRDGRSPEGRIGWTAVGAVIEVKRDSADLIDVNSQAGKKLAVKGFLPYIHRVMSWPGGIDGQTFAVLGSAAAWRYGPSAKVGQDNRPAAYDPDKFIKIRDNRKLQLIGIFEVGRLQIKQGIPIAAGHYSV